MVKVMCSSDVVVVEVVVVVVCVSMERDAGSGELCMLWACILSEFCLHVVMIKMYLWLVSRSTLYCDKSGGRYQEIVLKMNTGLRERTVFEVV